MIKSEWKIGGATYTYHRPTSDEVVLWDRVCHARAVEEILCEIEWMHDNPDRFGEIELPSQAELDEMAGELRYMEDNDDGHVDSLERIRQKAIEEVLGRRE